MSYYTIFQTIMFAAFIILASYALAEMFHVFADDSQNDLGLCLQGNQAICDKIDIDKLYEQMLNMNQAYGQSACFNSQELADIFTNQTDGKTKFTVVVPCPEFNKSTVPKDESGK